MPGPRTVELAGAGPHPPVHPPAHGVSGAAKRLIGQSDPPDGLRAADAVAVAPFLRGAVDVPVVLAATPVVSVVHHQRVNPVGRQLTSITCE
jgi:hypothetical protein